MVCNKLYSYTHQMCSLSVDCWLPFPILFPCFFDGFNVFPIFFWCFSHDFDVFPMILMFFPWFWWSSHVFFSAFSPIWTWVSSPFRSGRRSGRLRPAARGERRPSHTRLLDLAEDAPSLGGEERFFRNVNGACGFQIFPNTWWLMGFNQQKMWF